MKQVGLKQSSALPMVDSDAHQKMCSAFLADPGLCQLRPFHGSGRTQVPRDKGRYRWPYPGQVLRCGSAVHAWWSTAVCSTMQSKVSSTRPAIIIACGSASTIPGMEGNRRRTPAGMPTACWSNWRRPRRHPRRQPLSVGPARVVCAQSDDFCLVVDGAPYDDYITGFEYEAGYHYILKADRYA